MSATDFRCRDYIDSTMASDGFWDDRAQLWLIMPLRDVVEQNRSGERFLIVGHPGVDGIEFGYRYMREGFWAYHPMRDEYQLMAEDLTSFLRGWQSGAITI